MIAERGRALVAHALDEPKGITAMRLSALKNWMPGPMGWSFMLLMLSALLFASHYLAMWRFDWVGMEGALRQRLLSGAETVDFAKDFDLEFDQMFVFAPYSSEEQVEEITGCSWPGFARRHGEDSESICLLVFTRNGKIEYWYEQPRNLEFVGLTYFLHVGRAEAEFRVHRKGTLSQESFYLESI